MKNRIDKNLQYIFHNILTPPVKNLPSYFSKEHASLFLNKKHEEIYTSMLIILIRNNSFHKTFYK